MAVSWRLQVLSAAGSSKPTLDLDDAVAGLESFSVDGAGSCGEASFTALPSAVDIEPRDVVTLQYSEGGAAYQNVYRGVVTSAGSTRAPTLQQYRAVGLKQRAYEVPVYQRKIVGGDVAQVAGLVLATAYQNIVGGQPAIDFEGPAFLPTGFTVGDLFPRLETVGDVVDQLAALVGSFVVPVDGGDYYYDGWLYDDLETVPAVRWGVNALGMPFFIRPRGGPLLFDPTDRSTRVLWRPREAERVSDRIVLVYASEYVEGTSRRFAWADEERVGQPLTYQSGTGSLNAARTVLLPNPIDYMENLLNPNAATGDVTNSTNAFDDNPLTEATFGAALTGKLSGGVGWDYDGGYVENGCIVEVMFTGNGNVRGGNDYNLWVNATLYSSSGANLGVVGLMVPPVDDIATKTLYVPILIPAGVSTPVWTIKVDVYGASGVEVQMIKVWTPDLDTADRIAQGYMQPVQNEVALIEYQGLLQPVEDLSQPVTARSRVTVKIPPEPGFTATYTTVQIERVEVSITTDEGIVSRVYAGQAFEPDLEAQRVVLERLAERVASRTPVRRLQ